MIAFKGTLAAATEVRRLVSKAMGYPLRGVSMGPGTRAPSPQTWDGLGAAPHGWTESPVALYVGATEAACQLPDDVAASTLGTLAQSRLTGPERAALAVAVAQRADVDLNTLLAATPAGQSVRKPT